MTQVTRHEPGSFSWAELATSDPRGAKEFYGSLFGWHSLDNPTGPGPEDIYTRLQIDGDDVCALYRMMPEQASRGVPPNWLCYVTVSSADEAAKRAKELGGTVVAEPFDVMSYGRMAIFQDPTGAMFAVWQPRTHIGALRVNEPGALCWCELATREPEAAGEFYSGLFGWSLKASADSSYTEFLRGEAAIGGMYALPPGSADVPPNWMIYFQTSDCDDTADRAKALHGEVLVGPKDMLGVGRFAVLQDPQGAAFSIIELAVTGKTGNEKRKTSL
jgi:predicted enzyme related to lactoylglutathione lyase